MVSTPVASQDHDFLGNRKINNRGDWHHHEDSINFSWHHQDAELSARKLRGMRVLSLAK